MKSLRVVLVAALTACACCKDTPRPTTCTGLALRQCADGDFCLLVEGSDAGTGRCHPAAGYSCDDSSIQRLCDAERGEPSCAYCAVQGPDPENISLLACLPPADCIAP